MKCNCISVIEKNLAEKYRHALGVSVEVRCQNEGFLIAENELVNIHFTNYKITAQAKGFAKGKVMPVHANFCPFCGKSVKDEVK